MDNAAIFVEIMHRRQYPTEKPPGLDLGVPPVALIDYPIKKIATAYQFHD
jgi:hypothetical protein